MQLHAVLVQWQLHTEGWGWFPGPEFGRLTWKGIIGSPLRNRGEDTAGDSAIAAYTAPRLPRSHGIGTL